jgi:hypothetical protein
MHGKLYDRVFVVACADIYACARRDRIYEVVCMKNSDMHVYMLASAYRQRARECQRAMIDQSPAGSLARSLGASALRGRAIPRSPSAERASSLHCK